MSRETISVEIHRQKLIKPFAVPTPKPYFVEGDRMDDGAKARLLNQCAVLWKVLDMLSITPITAYTEDYTLNQLTYDALRSIAMKREMFDVDKIVREQLS